MDMLWILLPIAAAFFYMMSSFIDNYLTDVHFKRRDPAALVLTGVIAASLSVAVMLAWRGFDLVIGVDWVVAVGVGVAGFLNILAQVMYYRALKVEDTTSVTIFAQLQSVMLLLLGVTLLGEDLTILQLLAFFLILSSAVMLVFNTTTKKKFQMGVKAGVLMLFACVMWAIGDVSFVWFGRGVERFEEIYVWYCLGVLLALGFFTLTTKAWRRAIKCFFSDNRSYKMRVVLTNELFAVAAEMLYRVALLMMPVAIVGVVATSGQLILTFVAGILLTMIVPTFGREKLERKKIFTHVLAIVLVIVGIILIH